MATKYYNHQEKEDNVVEVYVSLRTNVMCKKILPPFPLNVWNLWKAY